MFDLDLNDIDELTVWNLFMLMVIDLLQFTVKIFFLAIAAKWVLS